MSIGKWWKNHKKKRRLEEVRKNPYKRVNSDKMTDVEKMDKGFDGKTYSVTIIDQLKNPNYPTLWWIRNESDYGLLHPSPTYYQPIRLAAAESVLLSYRVVVQYGSLSAKLINRLAKLNF